MQNSTTSATSSLGPCLANARSGSGHESDYCPEDPSTSPVHATPKVSRRAQTGSKEALDGGASVNVLVIAGRAWSTGYRSKSMSVTRALTKRTIMSMDLSASPSTCRMVSPRVVCTSRTSPGELVKAVTILNA